MPVLQIIEELSFGLRPNRLIPPTKPSFSQFLNVQPTQYGAEKVPAISDLFGTPFGTEVYSWPYPLVLDKFGSNPLAIIKITGTGTPIKLYSVSSAFSFTNLPLYDASDRTVLVDSITAGGVPHVADFGPVWFVFDGENVLFKHNLAATTTGFVAAQGGVPGAAQSEYLYFDPTEGEGLPFADKVLLWDATSQYRIKTGCAFKGRLIMGGFDSNGSTKPWGTLGNNYVMWSSISGPDMFWTLIPDLTEDTDCNSRYSREYRWLEKMNEWGYMPMPWRGWVQCVKPLGEGVMVYGDGGVSFLNYPAGPAATFGIRNLLNVGVCARGAIGGDENEHIFIDGTGSLWKITAELEMSRLGYQEFLAQFVAEGKVWIVKEPLTGSYFITGEVDGVVVGYVYSSDGLCEVGKNVRGILLPGYAGDAYQYGTLWGGTKASASTQVILTTTPMDAGMPDLKKIQAISVGYEDITNVTVTVYYRTGPGSAWSNTTALPLNRLGEVATNLECSSFYISLSGTPGTNPSVSWIAVHWEHAGGMPRNPRSGER